MTLTKIEHPFSTRQDKPRNKLLLGETSHWGLEIEYDMQPSPDGFAQALINSDALLDGSPSVLILGDNIFYHRNFGATVS